MPKLKRGPCIGNRGRGKTTQVNPTFQNKKKIKPKNKRGTRTQERSKVGTLRGERRDGKDHTDGNKQKPTQNLMYSSSHPP